MLKDEWYKPLLARVNTRVPASDVGAVINKPRDKCEPELKYLDTDVWQLAHIERMIACGISPDVASLVTRLRVGVLVDQIENEDTFICAFGDSTRRSSSLGSGTSRNVPEGDFYFMGASAMKVPKTNAQTINDVRK